MIININPLDTLFFRDGKPFSMGTETWADGVFPPSPSVIYGALSSLWIAQQAGGFGVSKNIDDSKKLKIKGIYLKKGEELALPVPRDLVHDKYHEDIRIFLEPTIEAKNVSHKMPQLAIPKSENFVEEYDEGTLLGKDDFENYLKKEVSSIAPIPPKDYLRSESKIGIGRDFNTHVTEEGRLYRVDFKRLIEGATIVVEFEDLTFDTNRFIRLGGEGKAAKFSEIQNSTFSKIAHPSVLKDNMFRVILTTPAIFSNGSLPSWINKETLKGEYKGIELELISASLGRPLSIGGWDLREKAPKTMYRAVPTGSVYWFKYWGATDSDIFAAFHQKSITDEKENEGFGIAVVGQ